jgi:histone acetyltransferase (RNA polymerase elongator complex component)
MHPWIRVNRGIREIPLSYISGGCSEPNMRQSLSKISNCKCIRCREVKGKEIKDSYRKIRKYESNYGTEIFISYETNDEKVLYGFIRLRIPWRKSNIPTFPELKNSAFIRELHVYGDLSGVGQSKGSQHKGFGTKLLKDAERIALYNGYSNIAVISGNGVRNYYRKRGYNVTTKHGYLKKHMFNPIITFIFNCFVQACVYMGGIFHAISLKKNSLY